MGDYEFNLRLYSDDTPEIADCSKTRTVNDANRFVFDYLRKKIGKPLDERVFNVLESIGTGSFWHSLYAIDGCINELQTNLIEERMEKRRWARENFKEYELEKILNICANTALLLPFGISACPGDLRGHSILYRELVQKEDSMFYGVVDEDLRKKLNNGRFWEELPDMLIQVNYGVAYKRVEDVLMNNFIDLDISFAIPNGFDIFCRNNGKESDLNLMGLSNDAIDKYIEFVRRIEMGRKEDLISKDVFGCLVRPYVKVVGSYIDDGVLRFEDSEERLKNPLVIKYGALSVV